MSIENRNLSSLMPAWISVLGTGNNKVFAFLASSEPDAGTPTIKARSSGGRCRHLND
jgi:hypothetical protein